MARQILIRESAGIDRKAEFVRVSVPCARGEWQAQTCAGILAPSGEILPCQANILKHWPDGSIKWLLVDFAATVAAHSDTVWQLVPDPGPAVRPASIHIDQGADHWQVDTGAGVFQLDARIFRPFTAVEGQNGSLLAPGGSVCLFRLADGGDPGSRIKEITVEENGPLHAVIRMWGEFLTPFRPRLRFASRLHFYAGSMKVKIEVTLHNPRPALHPKGLWDLGDKGSVLFKDLRLSFPLAVGTTKHIFCLPGPNQKSIELSGDKGFSIYQESSGGENWQSPNHRNRAGQVPMTQRGYVVETDGSELMRGLRATPVVWYGSEKRGVAVAAPRFWQEFPKQVEAGVDRLQVALFPGRFPDLYELQGGEQKTHEFLVDFCADPDRLPGLLDPLQAIATPSVYRASAIFGDLPGDNDLVDQFVSASDILRKRETVDEYGWRNFGEIYADHEAIYHEGPTPFVSHYNNQYDFVAGAFRKAFASGSFEWWSLAAELARHVRDIDLYHTDLDREEYNHGLFWHTDHYAEAGLSTHRSYSREQEAAYELHTGGGGPGPEHCYATGLLLYYFQTGNPDFRQAVIELADWEMRALQGPQTLLATFKRGAGYLSLWLKSRGERRLFPRFPLSRGTGNAISVCLDAFEAGGSRTYLDQADVLIRQTIHPNDDLAGRNLLDAENGWSYTVLLATVGKFLDKKVELGEFDTGFAHARAGLLAYANWMAENEYPYLDKPEILEYPNETWPAQDLRKSVVFYQAARYAATAEEKEVFLKKGAFFFEYARQELSRHPGSSFARPVVLMLQNGWCGECFNDSVPTCFGNAGQDKHDQMVSGKPTPSLTFAAVIVRFAAELLHSLRKTSLRQELAWLRSRLLG